MMNRFEEEMLWSEMEEMGILPIETNVLSECAIYQRTETNHHGITYEVWKGVSGKIYHLIKERS